MLRRMSKKIAENVSNASRQSRTTRKDTLVLGDSYFRNDMDANRRIQDYHGGQISVTDVARPRSRVPLGLLFALAGSPLHVYRSARRRAPGIQTRAGV